MMEQDDKVFAAAHSLGSTRGFGPTPARNARDNALDGVDASAAGESEVGRVLVELDEVVGSTSAMEPETPHGSRALGGANEDTGEGPSDAPASALSEEADDKSAKPSSTKTPKISNNVRKIRIERMMSKAELARRANLSVLTIDRVERGYGCRVDTKRKILEALGLSLADRVRVFGEEE
jgi:DNA-binding XRE family transcriptional regulator